MKTREEIEKIQEQVKKTQEQIEQSKKQSQEQIEQNELFKNLSDLSTNNPMAIKTAVFNLLKIADKAKEEKN